MEEKLIKRFNGEIAINKLDNVIAETRYSLSVNGEEIFVFTCLNEYIKEMCYGYLLTTQFISEGSDVQSFKIIDRCISIGLEVKKKENIRLDELIVTYSVVYTLFKDFIDNSILHKKTGAVHSMAIANENEIIIQIDDISRHTALDKIIGFCLLNNIELTDKILLSTCRITESIAQKISATKISAVFSKSAVTEQAIQICNEHQILLVGFIKKDSFNVYTMQERIV